MVNGTWSIVKLPPGEKAIGSRWVFKVKNNADGSIERYKARIVAKGFSQRPGQDYFETYASTMQQDTFRAILTLAAIEDMYLQSVDISHAFINSDIDTEVYMKQPEGFEQGGPEYVCKLNKSLYGLKQSPRLWGEKLAAVLGTMGFNKLKSDPSVYLYVRDDVRIIVPVFVDDITIASKSVEAADKFVEELSSHFKLRDLGPTSYLLGVEVTWDQSKHLLYLHQRQYILDKLKEFGMDNCKARKTPMIPKNTLSLEQCPKTPEEKQLMLNIPYMNAVGSLMYLAMMTRPDIAYAVGVLARFNANPGMEHWRAVKHLFRYLKGTLDLKLTLGLDPDIGKELFITYTDADHGGCKDSRKSTSGYMVKLGQGVVSWRSKLQPVVTKSTTEAEFVAANDAGKQILWIQNLLHELGYTPCAPSVLYIDNNSALSVAKNPDHHGRMKHLDLSYYWLREKVAMKKIEPVHLATDNMPADLLTKPLARVKVEKFRSMMGLRE